MVQEHIIKQEEEEEQEQRVTPEREMYIKKEQQPEDTICIEDDPTPPPPSSSIAEVRYVRKDDTITGQGNDREEEEHGEDRIRVLQTVAHKEELLGDERYASSRMPALHTTYLANLPPLVHFPEVLRVSALITEVTQFTYRTGIYQLDIRIEDGTDIIVVRVCDKVTASIIGKTCKQLLQDHTNPTLAVDNKRRMQKMELQLRQMEGTVYLSARPGVDTPVVVLIERSYRVGQDAWNLLS